MQICVNEIGEGYTEIFPEREKNEAGRAQKNENGKKAAYTYLSLDVEYLELTISTLTGL